MVNELGKALKHRLTYQQLEDYGVSGAKILVNIIKGRYINYTAELLQYDDKTKVGIYLIYLDKDIRLLRQGTSDVDFEFVSMKKQQSLMQVHQYNEPKLYTYNDIVNISLDFLYLTEPFLENYTNMSTMLNYRKEFPPYIFTDEIYLSDNNHYRFIFEGGRFFVFRVIFNKHDVEEYIKLFEHQVNPDTFKIITKYDSLKLNLTKNLNKYLNKKDNLNSVKGKIIELEDFKLDLKTKLINEKEKLYK